MSRSEKKRRHVHTVIDMFASLGLPVCDDEEAIAAKRDEQRGARNRELNSTKGSVAAKAQQWFDDVNALLNRRDELLGQVYEEFAALSDAILRAGIDGGRATLSADTQLSLRDMAISWCRARPDLADRWLLQFLEQRGLTEGDPVDQAKLVRDFRATPRGARVQLSWNMPPENCDEVRIVRTPDPLTGDADETLVYQGKDSAFTDGSIVPKAHYTYRAYSVFQGRRSLTSAVVTTRRHKKKSASGSRRLPIVAATVVVLAMAAVGYDHYLGQDRILGAHTTPAGSRPTVQGWLAPSTTTSPGTKGGTHVAAAGQDPASTAAPTPAPEPEPEPELPAVEPPSAIMTDPPRIAFSGQSLNLVLALSGGPVRSQLVEPRLQGLQLKRMELDASPPAIRFVVDELPPSSFEGQASWSFRLAGEGGTLSNEIRGSCQILPGS